jgi:hypothetical protein
LGLTIHKEEKMKSRWVFSMHILLALVVAWGLGFSQASAIGAGQTGQTPESPASVNSDSALSTAFNYQGSLKENGLPVNGVRSMSFSIYWDAACASTHDDIGPYNVTVTNGLFNVPLDFSAGPFGGSAVWLEVIVAGTSLGCQELRAVPYALGLRPGTMISGNIPSGILDLGNYSSGSDAHGLGASAGGSGAAGVVGRGTSAQAYGLKGINTFEGGVAIYSQGAFSSSADSILQLSPHAIIDRGTTSLTFTPQDTGGMRIIGTAGTYYVTLPISAVGKLFGSQFYIKKISVDYHVSGSAKITATQVLKSNGAAGYSFYLNQVGDHASTVRETYTTSATLPCLPLDAASYVQFTLMYSDTGNVYIEKVELTLSQSPN